MKHTQLHEGDVVLVNVDGDLVDAVVIAVGRRRSWFQVRPRFPALWGGRYLCPNRRVVKVTAPAPPQHEEAK